MKQQQFEKILEENKSYEFQGEKLEGRINYNYFQGFVDFVKVENIKFIGCEINTLELNFVDFQELSFENCQINNIILNQCVGVKFDLWKGTRINKILFHNSCKFKVINFDTDIVVNDYLEIYKNEIGALLLCGTIRNAYIETKVNLLDLRFLKAIDYIKLVDLDTFDNEHRKQISISGTHTKLIFSSCNFDNYDSINIESSDLSEVDFFNSIPLNIDVVSSQKHKLKREYYRQIKSGYSRNNDNINRLFFQRLELESYRKGLSFKFSNFGKLILLQLNRFSNYYGTRWYCGVIFTLIIGLAFFIGCWLVSNRLICSFEYFTKLFVLFINPAHDFDFWINNPNGWLMLIDATSRIFISYGYYQTIQAFRIYGKN